MRWACPAPLPEQERVACFYGLWVAHGFLLGGGCVPDDRADAAERGMAASPMGQRACCCWGSAVRGWVCWGPAALGRLLEPIMPMLVIYACAFTWTAAFIVLQRGANATGHPP